VADAYELYANATQRALLLRDFYGKEVALFEPRIDGPSGLKDVLEGAEGERRRRILGAVKENLTLMYAPGLSARNLDIDETVIDSTTQIKAPYRTRSSTVPCGSTCSSCARSPRKKRVKRRGGKCSKSAFFAISSPVPVVDSLAQRPFACYSCQELLAEVVHTKDGSLCVREFLAWGSAKDRKQILKVLKPHLERIWTNEEGQLVLFTALDVIECVPSCCSCTGLETNDHLIAIQSSSPSLSWLT